MNKINCVRIIILSTTLTLLQSCEKDPSKHYSEAWLEYEESWGECFNTGFDFPYDTITTSPQFLQCEFNGHKILIKDGGAGFSSEIYYQSSFVTSAPNAPLTGNEGLKTSILIFFLEPDTFKNIGLIIPYPLDSLNYTIQNLFSNSTVSFSGNFIESKPSLSFGSVCSWNKGAVSFSTLYSDRTDQSFHVDSFSYKFEENQWVYHLEYSCDGIEVTNAGWNSKGKIDRYGNILKSDLLVESLVVNNLICRVDFVLPNG